MLAKQTEPSRSPPKFTVDRKCEETQYRDSQTVWKMGHILDISAWHCAQPLPLALAQACLTVIKNTQN